MNAFSTKPLYTLTFLLANLMFLISSCGSGNSGNSPSDLNFNEVETAAAFNDLIIKAIKTNRSSVILSKYSKDVILDENSLSAMINAYSQAIGKKKWEYEAYTFKGKEITGYGYRWLDPYSRTAIIIEINNRKDSKEFSIDQIEFASRLDVLDSYSYPGGEVSENRLLLNSKDSALRK